MQRPESARRGLEDIEGQTCVVTGASQGIGLATARELAQHGACVVLTSRDRGRAENAAFQLSEKTKAPVLGLSLDVTNPTQVAECIAEACEWQSSGIHVLINNAGLPVVPEVWNTPFHDVPLDRLTDWFERVHAVDVAGARNCTRAVLPIMMAQRLGSIVFLSSTPALSGHHATPYTESKAALLGLMKDTALNYARYNVRANAVALGDIQTSWFDQNSPEQQAALAASSPMGRWGDPEEAARGILFLASPMSSFITGQTLVIDGGTRSI